MPTVTPASMIDVNAMAGRSCTSGVIDQNAEQDALDEQDGVAMDEIVDNNRGE
jgi:hypothetical protein